VAPASWQRHTIVPNPFNDFSHPNFLLSMDLQAKLPVKSKVNYAALYKLVHYDLFNIIHIRMQRLISAINASRNYYFPSSINLLQDAV
jgi:hypothetical protein